MEQTPTPVMRGKKQKANRWCAEETVPGVREKLREMGRIALQMLAPFLLSFCEIMGVPSGLQTAWMAAQAALGDSLLWPLCGCLLSFGMRALWGLPLNWGAPVSWALALLGPRLVFKKGLAQLMAFTGAALLPSLVQPLLTGNTGDKLLAVAMEIMGVLSAPVLFRGMHVCRAEKPVTQTEDCVSVCFMLAVLLGGGSRLSLFGLQLGTICAAFLTACAGYYLGEGGGTLMGMLSGIAMAAQGYPLDLAVGLSAGGFLAGLTRRRERELLSAFAFAVGCGAVLLLSGRLRGSWVLQMLLGTAAWVCCPVVWQREIKLQMQRLSHTRRMAEDQYAALLLTRWEHAMKEMADEVPLPRAEPSPHDPVWWRGHLCAGCPLEKDCSCMSDMRAALQVEDVWAHRQEGEEDFLQAMEGLRGLGCGRLYLLRERMAALRREDHLHCAAVRRAVHEREMVRTHLLAAAGAAQALAEVSTGEDWWEAAMVRRVQSVLGERSFPAELLFARRLHGRACLGFRETATLPVGCVPEQLRTLLREEAGLTLEAPRQEDGLLIYEETPRWRVDAGWAARALVEDEEGTGNGDAILMTRLPDGRFLGMLSDGMGHGHDAHEESTRALELMRLCLQAGYTVEQTLTAVNGMMLSATQGEEYATVDLFLADLWLGQGELHKLGACMSVLVCDGKDVLLEGAALPLGILEDITPQCSSFRLCAGQQLFLMSDGITDVMETGDLRAACLRAAGEETAEQAASALLEAAADAAGEDLHDDASCAVIRIARTEQAEKETSFWKRKKVRSLLGKV